MSYFYAFSINIYIIINKLKEYTQKVHICGERNSYSKTDHDATFMRMKEDAIGNGQLKAGYSVQHGVDSEYITCLTVGPQPTDTTTLIPFLNSMESHLKFKYEKIVADAGYESEENYLYIETNGQLSYINPARFHQRVAEERADNIRSAVMSVLPCISPAELCITLCATSNTAITILNVFDSIITAIKVLNTHLKNIHVSMSAEFCQGVFSR